MYCAKGNNSIQIVENERITRKQSYKRTLSNSFFCLSTNDMEMNLGINLCILMDQNLVVFWKSFLSLPNNDFEEEWFLSEIFIKLKCSGYKSSHLKSIKN